METGVVIACYVQQADAQDRHQVRQIVGSQIATRDCQIDVAHPSFGIEVLVKLALLVIRDKQDLHRAGGPPVTRQIARRARR